MKENPTEGYVINLGGSRKQRGREMLQIDPDGAAQTHKPGATPVVSGVAVATRYRHLTLEERCRLRGLMETITGTRYRPASGRNRKEAVCLQWVMCRPSRPLCTMSGKQR